jgi:hypothetical protein
MELWSNMNKMDTKYFSDIKLRLFIHYMFDTGNFYFQVLLKLYFIVKIIKFDFIYMFLDDFNILL